MKVLFTRGSAGKVEFAIVPDDVPDPPGAMVASVDDFAIDEMPSAWAANRVWPPGESAPRLPTTDERLQEVKAAQAAAVRAAAEVEASRTASSVEHRAVGRRWARPNTQLTPREQALLDSDAARYTKLTGLLDRIDAATTEAEVSAVSW